MRRRVGKLTGLRPSPKRWVWFGKDVHKAACASGKRLGITKLGHGMYHVNARGRSFIVRARNYEAARRAACARI